LNLRSGLSYYLRPCTVELVAEKERERFAPMQLARRYGGDGGAWTEFEKQHPQWREKLKRVCDIKLVQAERDHEEKYGERATWRGLQG